MWKMANLPMEIKFAQNLAGNEKKVRSKALKKLKKYLKAKSSSKKDGFSTDDFLKLWKGLHYCMWMQDKPLLQEELSSTLTQLIHDLSTVEAQMMFLKVYFITVAREWNSIDIWRLDKFMMMVRNMVYESLIVMKKLKWAPTHMENLAQIFSDMVMNPNSDVIPDGIKIHFCDIYLDEVEKVGDGQLSGFQLLTLLVPFIKFIQKGKNPTIVRRVISRVFEPVITRMADEVKHTQNDESDMETSNVPFFSLKFDNKLIADHLFDVSQQECVLSRNRPLMYNIVRKLQDIQKGVLPQQREIAVSAGVTQKDIRQAVHSLVTAEEGKKGKKKHKKKNKKEKQKGDAEVNENADPNNNGTTLNVTEENQVPSTSSQVHGKRKHSLTDDGEDESLTKIKKKKLEDARSENKTLKKLRSKFTKLELLKGKKEKKMEIDVIEATEISRSTKRATPCSIKLQPSGIEQSTTVVKMVQNKSAAIINTSIISVSAEVPSTCTISMEKTTVVTPKTKGKRTHSWTEITDKTESSPKSPEATADKVPEIVVAKATLQIKSPVVKSPGIDIQDGEIEIFVPNKKYKGNKGTTPKSNFATFDQTKQPVAFVKRSLSKSLKKTPSTMRASGQTPGSLKRVSFDMKKNQAQGFKESLDSPLTPFNPTRKPDTGILKCPATTSTCTAAQGSSRKMAKYSNNSMQTPVTRQIIGKVGARNRSRADTPIVTRDFGKKKATPMRRKCAADFFL